VLAPAADDPALRVAVESLRAAGEIVVIDLPGEDRPVAGLGCNRALIQRAGKWRVEPV
jgi:ATP phosphoribosyltransferase regulatory subunit